MRKRSFTLLEMMIAFVLMSVCVTLLLQEGFRVRRKKSFEQECRELDGMIHQAVALASSAGEVNLKIRQERDAGKGPCLVAQIILWSTVPLKSPCRMEHEKRFSAITEISCTSLSGYHMVGASGALFYFFPRGYQVKLQRSVLEGNVALLLKGEERESMFGTDRISHTISFDGIVDPLKSLRRHITLPETIAQLAV